MTVLPGVPDTEITITFSQKLFGIGETGLTDFNSTSGLTVLTDSPTLY
jgi:hypothetical protein